ncbi:MAG: hypothetical protein MUD01_04510 [Chloroflexaceae bacterium]|nr:hypothetical protein [Chloroflexaceae bacterium]
MINYTISMLQPHSHLYDVRVEVDGLSAGHTDFVLPSWTPGSYMIREYARHVQEFAAESDGQPLPWHKVAKDTWRVDHGDAAQVSVSYRVYAYELTVRTSHLDDSHGYFNGTTVFMYVPGRTHEPLALDIITPAGWDVATGLETRRGAVYDPPAPTRFSFLAQDYDELVDCPCECGTHRLLTFEVEGKAHRIAIWGRGNYDEERVIDDSRRMVMSSSRLTRLPLR